MSINLGDCELIREEYRIDEFLNLTLSEQFILTFRKFLEKRPNIDITIEEIDTYKIITQKIITHLINAGLPFPASDSAWESYTHFGILCKLRRAFVDYLIQKKYVIYDTPSWVQLQNRISKNYLEMICLFYFAKIESLASTGL